MIKFTSDKQSVYAWVSVKERGVSELAVLLSFYETKEECKAKQATNSLDFDKRFKLPGVTIIGFPESFTGGREGLRKLIHESVIKYIESLKIKELTKTEIIL